MSDPLPPNQPKIPFSELLERRKKNMKPDKFLASMMPSLQDLQDKLDESKNQLTISRLNLKAAIHPSEIALADFEDEIEPSSSSHSSHQNVTFLRSNRKLKPGERNSLPSQSSQNTDKVVKDIEEFLKRKRPNKVKKVDVFDRYEIKLPTNLDFDKFQVNVFKSGKIEIFDPLDSTTKILFEPATYKQNQVNVHYLVKKGADAAYFPVRVLNSLK